MPQNGYQHMVLDHYVERLREVRRQRRERLAAIRTQADAQEYQCELRKAIRRAFSPRPRKTPLNTTVTGVLERDRYRIEKVTFESRPGCLVTGSLYVPKHIAGPGPGVIAPCGHSANGKAAPIYQAYYQRLAVNGFVVLAYDPFNQGERDQYFGLEGREVVRGCCNAHNMMGKQMELLGQYFGMWRAWDGIRALDVLLARNDVDPKRLAVTGNSGGGTMSTWLWACEERLAMAAPSCFVTTFMCNLENELPADCEQYPPGVIGAGLEMIDMMIARAPKPAILLGQTYDYFDRRGLREGYEELKRIYRIFRAEDKVALFIGPQGHGYSVHNQEAMVDFFSTHANIANVTKLPDPEELPDEELFATPQGEVVPAGTTPVYTLIARRAEQLAEKRGRLSGTDLRKSLARLLKMPPKRDVPHYRALRPVSQEGNTIARYAVETEGPIRAIVRKRLSEQTRAHAGTLDVEPEVHVWLPHVLAEDDMVLDPLARSINPAGALYGIDVRGLGESLPEERPGTGFFQPYGMDYMMHGYGVLFGESYQGRRVYDLLRVLDLLAAEGAERVHLYGRGQGALLALFATVLNESVASLTLKNTPLSYHDWTHAPLVAWPSANFLRSALEHFDLSDCIRAVSSKITIIEPWGPDMQPLEGEALDEAVSRASIPRELVRPAGEA